MKVLAAVVVSTLIASGAFCLYYGEIEVDAGGDKPRVDVRVFVD